MQAEPKASEPVLAGCDYHLDAQDRIEFVNERWLAFARENDAPGLDERVIGRPIWSFVQGAPVRQLYRTLFLQVRSRQASFSIPFRCDAPDRFRFMSLQLAPAGGGRILCSGRLLREQKRPYASLLDRSLPRSDYGYPICSLCKRVFAFGEWLELEDAIRQLARFDAARPPRLEEHLCDGCRRLGRAGAEGGSAAA